MVPLNMAERQGIEIDYCPQCRGVWLDRGELDKIIERTSGMYPSVPQPQASQPSQPAAQPQQPARPTPYQQQHPTNPYSSDPLRPPSSYKQNQGSHDSRYTDRYGNTNQNPPEERREGFFERLFDVFD